MNYVAGILIVIACTYMGFGYNNYYVAKLNIIKDFSTFIDFAIAEIAYLRTDLFGLIDKYNKMNPSVLSRALLSVDNPTMFGAEKLKLALLNNKEKQLVVTFIKDIASLGTDGQRAFAQEYKLRVNKQIEFIESEQLKKGMLVKKLAPFLGLGILIILI